MKKIIFFLILIVFNIDSFCNAEGKLILEKTDFSIKYSLDNDNNIYFEQPLNSMYPQPIVQVPDKELDRLIAEAVVKQKNHPTFDIQYAINSQNLKNKILIDLEKYYRFPEHHLKYQEKITENKLLTSIEQSRQKMVSREKYANLAIKDLQNLILDKLKINHLVKELSIQNFTVTCAEVLDKATYIEKKLIFENQYTGCFEVIILIPKTNLANYPAIIGLHGHNQSAEKFQQEFLIHILAEKGYIVIIPSFRAMGLTEVEYIISKKLLLNGFTLMGIRVYEALLVESYLKSLNEVDPARIGILAHSGGSSIASFLRIVSSSIKATVIDHQSSFISITDLYGIFDEIIPNLVDYAPRIHDYNTISNHSLLKVEYGQIKPEQNVGEYFEKYLK